MTYSLNAPELDYRFVPSPNYKFWLSRLECGAHSGGESTGVDLYALAVNNSGVMLVSDFPCAFPDFYAAIHYDSIKGVVYSDNGNAAVVGTGLPPA